MANAARNPRSNPAYVYAGAGARSEHSSYIEQIKNYPILSEPEERRLVQRWYANQDRAAYDALIGSHLRLVPKMALKYSGYGVPVGDLIGEGNIGLLQSAERFDPEKGFRFSTYARWWIRAAMLNFVLQTWSLIKVGNGAAKKRLFFNLRRAKQSLDTEGKRYMSEADIDSLADHFKVSREDIISMDQRMSANDVSLHQPVPGSDDLTIGDSIAGDEPNPEEILAEAQERGEKTRLLREAMLRLDRREKEIVTRRYLTKRPATLAKLASLYGLTAERIRQIEAKAIEKIKRAIGSGSIGPDAFGTA
jgi:RNA polymerase sigma-32 factor